MKDGKRAALSAINCDILPKRTDVSILSKFDRDTLRILFTGENGRPVQAYVWMYYFTNEKIGAETEKYRSSLQMERIFSNHRNDLLRLARPATVCKEFYTFEETLRADPNATLISIKDKSASGDCYTVNTGTLMRLGANAGATAYYGTAEVKIKGLPREAGEFGIYIPLRAVTTPEIYKEYHDWCVAQNFSYLKCD
jgi:hypothetical protein